MFPAISKNPSRSHQMITHLITHHNMGKSKIVPFLAPILMALLFFGAGCGKREGIVAKVGSMVITADEFKDVMIKRYRNEEFASRRNIEDRKSVLRNIIDNKLKLQDAYQLGLDKDSTVLATANEAQKMASIQELYRVAIMDAVIPETEIREQYDKMGEEIRTRHILFRTLVDLEEHEKKQVWEKAEDAMKKLKEGADFDSLARAISEDVTTAQNGGDLGYFTWGKMVDEFQKAAFALKVGEMSDIVESSYGLHIIKLEDRRPVKERKSFADEKENILMQLRQAHQDELNKKAEEYLNVLKDKYGLTYDYINIQKILDKVSDPSVPRNNSFFSDFTEEEKQWIVATLKNDTIRVTDLDAEIAKTGRPPQWRDQKSIIQMVERMVMPDFLAENAKERGLTKTEAAKKAYRESFESEMIMRAEKIQVDEKMDMSDSTLMAYYNGHLEEFMTDSTVEVQEIFIMVDEEKGHDKAYADRIAKRAKSGENFTKLVQKYSDRKSTLNKNGKIGPINSRQYGAIGKGAFSLKIGEIAGPVEMGKNGFSIYKLLDKTPAKVRPFEESKPQVERQVSMAQGEELRTTWMERLEKRYPITIYDNRLMKVLPPPEIAEEDSSQVKETMPTKELKVKEVIPIDKSKTTKEN